MTKVQVDKELLTPLKNIISTPCCVHLPSKLGQKVNTVLNLSDRNDWCTSAVLSSWSWNLIHTKNRDRQLERCKPFNICEWMFEDTIFLGNLEYDTNLTHREACPYYVRLYKKTLKYWLTYHPVDAQLLHLHQTLWPKQCQIERPWMVLYHEQGLHAVHESHPW